MKVMRVSVAVTRWACTAQPKKRRLKSEDPEPPSKTHISNQPWPRRRAK